MNGLMNACLERPAINWDRNNQMIMDNANKKHEAKDGPIDMNSLLNVLLSGLSQYAMALVKLTN